MAGLGTLLKLTTPLGAAAMLAVSMRGEESISNPFLLVIEAVSDRKDIEADKLLYQPVSLTIKRDHVVPGAESRHFHGICRRFTAGDQRDGAFRYIMEVVPKLWFASQTADSRIFHELDAMEIIQKILDENGVTDSKVRIQGTKTKRPFTVQYNETDLDFISRLMEEEGWFYYFEFAEGTHTLVIGDKNNGFAAIALPGMTVKANATTSDAISSWREYSSTAVGKVTLIDYDFKAPATPVKGEQATVLKTSGADKRDVTMWPALVDKSPAATARARLREEAAEAWARLYQGLGQNPFFAAGGKFTVGASDWVFGDAGDYIIRSVNHEAVDEAQAAGGRGAHYGNSFQAFPAAVQWRQPLSIPRPRMVGIFNAIVVGPKGEEIHTDEHMRIKLRFFWDHREDSKEGNTIWARVMQPWAGKGWGWQHIPRIGSEVAVSFVDGDPDHPIVVGSLYNGEQMPPWALPANKTITGIKSRSTMKGGTGDYNEFSFEDKKGAELVLLHAQKDHKITVENDQTITIMHDQIGKIDNDRKWEITKGNDFLEVKQGNRNVEIGTGNYEELVKVGNYSLKVDTGNIDEEAGKGNITTQAKMGNITLTASLGNVTVKAAAGKIEVEAAQSITLKVGGSSIKIDLTGVTIKGPMVKISGDMMLEMKGGMMTKLEGGMMLDMKGGMMTKVSGALVMIG